jgi:hypothetical protein
MQGTLARMRVSSVMAPLSSCGTLRSARMKTRWPRALPLGAQIGEADDVHGGCVGWMKNLSILWSTRSLALDPRQSL